MDISMDDLNKQFNYYVERFNYYLNWTMVRFNRGLRTDQYIALGSMLCGLILIIISILIW